MRKAGWDWRGRTDARLVSPQNLDVMLPVGTVLHCLAEWTSVSFVKGTARCRDD